MSSIVVKDLAHSASLDQGAMALVSGGNAFGPKVNVNLNIDQEITQFQQIGINVLNGNGVIGAGFKGPDIDVAAKLFAANNAVF
ncbi:hypothetical protein [Massilia sp. Leaf139]|uniref:hypothetical protein n=1 Tax=Massilia sp. Leaf139 TaxID=1736272 RepID=UPI0007006E18|nr:hypothetical protein [Massilia sp. Leaf139]KQQ97185.1 hypothetical protein ASF77_04290 [Massilia sp. Leaf139]